MGKAAKAHRAKVEKRNRKVSQDRYSMQNALNKMMKKMVEEKQNEELQVKVGNENVPFEVVTQPTNTGIKGFEFGGNVSFKEEHPEMTTEEVINVETETSEEEVK